MKKSVFIAIICLCFISNIFGQAKIKVLRYQAPEYPAAAQATRTSGEVRVSVKIDKEGKVISAKTESGRSFFKVIAEEAAAKWLFSEDNNLEERNLEITFVFNVKNNKSFKNNYRDTKIKTSLIKPYRLEISATIYPRINA